MPDPPLEPEVRGGIHIGDVGGNVAFSALGDIVGGDKIIHVTTTIQISVDAVKTRALNTASPYRGLDSFQDRDRALFFGRDQSVKSLLSRVAHDSLLLVLGASGSGKSSLVRAGLLPALSELMGSRLRYFVLVPDRDPFEALRSSLVNAGISQADAQRVTADEPEVIARNVHGLQRRNEQWLLFLDQFEEIFTRTPELLRKRFVSSLLALTREPHGAIKVVLCMRADFLDRFGPFPEFGKRIESNIELVTDMHSDELRLAIEQPAAQHGVVLEAGLVEEILKDVEGQAGALPLLQYSLDQLWEEERKHGLDARTLHARAYRELGGVRGALQQRAEDLYTELAGQGPEAERASRREIARRIFLRLVDVAPAPGSADAAWKPVRRRIAIGSFTASEQEIVRFLVDHKLLVSNHGSAGTAALVLHDGEQAIVEVAHEALFACWNRLKQWIAEAQPVIFVKNRLSDDAARYARMVAAGSTQASDELWSGSRLDQALELRAKGEFAMLVGGLSEVENGFLDRSASEREQRRRAERKRQRMVTVGLSAGLAIAALLSSIAGFAWRAAKTGEVEALRQTRIAREQTGVAEQQRRNALAHQLYREAERNVVRSANDVTVTTLLTIESLKAKWTPDALKMLFDRRALIPPRPERRWRAHPAPISGFALSADGAWLATTDGPELVVWDLASQGTAPDKGSEVFRVDHASELASVTHQIALAFSPDRKWLAAGCEPKVCVWNLDQRGQEPILVGSDEDHGYVLSLAFSPDGQALVVASDWPRVFAVGGDWREHGSAPQDRQKQQTSGLAFHPSGYFAANTVSLGIGFFDIGSRGAIVQRDRWATSGGWGVAFSRSGRYLASATAEGVLIGELRHGAAPVGKAGLSTSLPRAFAFAEFSRDDRYLMAGPSGALFWAADFEDREHRPWLYLDGVSQAGFAAGKGERPSWLWDEVGRLVAGLKNDVAMYDLAAPRREIAVAQYPSLRGIAFSADSRRLVAATCDDRGFHVHFLDARDLARVAAVDDAEVRSCQQLSRDDQAVAASFDGRLAAAVNGSELMIASAAKKDLARADVGSAISLVTFRADATAVAVATSHRLVVASLGPPLETRAMDHDDNDPTVSALGFSPDGRFVVAESDGYCQRAVPIARVRLIWDSATGKRVARQSLPPRHSAGCSGGAIKERTPDEGDPVLLARSAAWPMTAAPGQKLSTADGRFVVSDAVRAVDLATGHAVDVLVDEYDNHFAPALLSPDGRWAATTDRRDSIRLWPLATDDLIADTCARLHRNLTEDEWKAAVGTTPAPVTCPGAR